MGAGSFPAGYGPAGFDPAFVPDVRPAPFMPRALVYQPTTQRFELFDKNGNQVDIHPVDQIVAVRCFIERGSSPSNPTLGDRLRALTARKDPRQVPQIALQEVRRLLGDLVTAGDIKVTSVYVDQSIPGRKQFAITYVNLRDPTVNKLFPTPPATRLVI
jgi:hypothetical protein